MSAKLGAVLTDPSGAAGSVYYSLLLTNAGSATCTLDGYPGVSAVTGSAGTQVGAAAQRTTGTSSVVTLAPGESARSVLQIVDASNYGTGCGITATAGLRVYPPGQTAALYVAHPDKACVNPNDVTLRVGPLTHA